MGFLWFFRLWKADSIYPWEIELQTLVLVLRQISFSRVLGIDTFLFATL